MNTKLIVLIAILVVGGGVAVYMWTSASRDAAGDAAVLGKMQSFTCKKCGQTFQKTQEEITAERRGHDGHIYCPHCNAEDPEKEGVVVRMGGAAAGGEAKTFESDDKAKEENPDEQTSAPGQSPKLSAPGMKKRKG
jgi:hypothetical protein